MTTVVAEPLTLADLLPRHRARTVALVVGFALLTALAAQISFLLPWTPVPVTGQTFAVLLAGATLGWRAGSASQLLYLVLGAVGLPFYADGLSGWKVLSGPTAGYLVGFVVAAALVGRLAERRQDRSLLTSVPAMLAGTAVIYLFGVTWLAHVLDVGAATAVEKGLAPFVIGDVLKLAAAGALLPAAWRLAGHRHDPR
ncbi:MAG: biotin transporter BioY [Actinobacteria bacterium]|nr:biotin transporter BioY [Actinomycetota bacterium]